MSGLVYLMEEFMPTSHRRPNALTPTTASQLMLSLSPSQSSIPSPVYHFTSHNWSSSYAAPVLFAWQQFLF